MKNIFYNLGFFYIIHLMYQNIYVTFNFYLLTVSACFRKREKIKDIILYI